MPHTHGSASGAHRGRLAGVFVLTLLVFVVQLAGGLLTGSLALLADAGHNATDVAGIGLALLAISFAARPATGDRTFGFLRLEILAAVINAVLLFGVAAYVLIEAWRRWSDPPEVASGPMLAIALVGLGANAISLYAPARRATGQPQHARRVPGGHGRPGGLGGGHRGRRGHRRDRLAAGGRRWPRS